MNTVVGICGGSGSGKTTLCRTIAAAAGPPPPAVISHDAYYRDFDDIPRADLERRNFDHPEALDSALLATHLRRLKQGESVEIPIYDFSRHRRSPETQRIAPQPVILVEGILLFAEPALRDLFDAKIFVDVDADIRLARRIERDIGERGRTLEGVLAQYEATVRPMHLEFVEPSKRWADVIVPEGGENRVALEMVIARIEQLLALERALAGL